MIKRRRRVKQTYSLEERIAQEAERLREQAKNLPPGRERETMLRKVRQAEAGLHMSEMLRLRVRTHRNKLAQSKGPLSSTAAPHAFGVSIIPK